MSKIVKLFQGDLVIWIIYFMLCLVSLVEVFSASSTLAYRDGSFWAPLIKQAIFLGVGTILVVILHNIPCRYFKLIPVIFLPVCVGLLLLTMLAGTSANSASRWLSIGFIQFQPSELAKGAVIVSVALILAQTQREDGADKSAFKYILWVAGGVCLLIVTENLSTAAMLFGVVFLMMWIGRVPLKLMAKLSAVLVAVVVLFASVVLIAPKDSFVFELPGFHRALTWKNRLAGHGAEKNVTPQDYDIDKDAQVAHARIAIASSNYIGKMPGNSVQRDFLSQAYSDFIFAIIIEELGIWGAFFVVAFYIVFLFRAGRIASRCERNFPAFLAMGLALLIVAQALLNMMVAVGLFPVTGQPLPLVSRGGTSTIITCAYFGMILSVSRYARKSKEPAEVFPEKGLIRAKNKGLVPEED